MLHEIPSLSTLSSLAIDPLRALTNEDLLKEHDDIFHVYVKTIAGNASESVLGSIFGEKTLCKMLPILEDGEMTIKNGDDDSKRIYEKMVDAAKKIKEIINPSHKLLSLNSLSFINIMNYINDSKNDLSNLLLSACDNGYSGIVNAIIMSDSFFGSERVDGPIVTPNVRLDFEYKLFNQAFTKACEKGHVEIVEMMLSSNRFQIEENPANDNHQINWSMGLCNAAKHGHLDVFKTIIESNHGVNIPVFDVVFNSFSKAFYNACKYDHLDIVKFIMKMDHFNEIPVNNFYGLSGALCIAAKRGSLDIFKAIIESNHGSEITIYNGEFSSLTKAFYNACKYDHLDIVKFIMNMEHFNEMPANEFYGLGGALNRALENHHYDVVKEIINNERFHEIDGISEFIGIGSLLCNACLNGELEIVKKIEGSRRFDEILISGGENISLYSAFNDAVTEGYSDIVKLFLSNEKYEEIFVPEEGFCVVADAFIKAVKMGHTGVVKAIIENDRFSEIQPSGLYGLNVAFTEAVMNDHVEIVRAIIESGRFSEILEFSKFLIMDKFINSIENGHNELVRIIMESGLYSNISDELKSLLIKEFERAARCGHDEILRLGSVIEFVECNLLLAFSMASQHGCNKILNMVLRSKNFKNIEINFLAQSLFTCAENNQITVFSEIINCNRFKDIPPNEIYGLGHLLYILISSGKITFARELLFSNRLNEIDAEGPFGMDSIMKISPESLLKEIKEELEQEKLLTRPLKRR